MIASLFRITCETSKSCQVCGSSFMPGSHTLSFNSLRWSLRDAVPILYRGSFRVNLWYIARILWIRKSNLDEDYTGPSRD